MWSSRRGPSLYCGTLGWSYEYWMPYLRLRAPNSSRKTWGRDYEHGDLTNIEWLTTSGKTRQYLTKTYWRREESWRGFLSLLEPSLLLAIYKAITVVPERQSAWPTPSPTPRLQQPWFFSTWCRIFLTRDSIPRKGEVSRPLGAATSKPSLSAVHE